MTRISPRLVSFLTLILLAVIGTFIVLKATPEGLELSDDSIAYIAGARSMLAGNGYREMWLESNGPVTHFPPVEPVKFAGCAYKYGGNSPSGCCFTRLI